MRTQTLLYNLLNIAWQVNYSVYLVNNPVYIHLLMIIIFKQIYCLLYLLYANSFTQEDQILFIQSGWEVVQKIEDV